MNKYGTMRKKVKLLSGVSAESLFSSIFKFGANTELNELEQRFVE